MEIEYAGFDLEGQPICRRAMGLEARIVQHEIDHLNGILFLARIDDPDSLTTRAAMNTTGAIS